MMFDGVFLQGLLRKGFQGVYFPRVTWVSGFVGIFQTLFVLLQEGV